MIKFFRHIRRSLIQKNKMGKYFKYAIGEIILVVIGILIALQINNWNEGKKIRKVELGLLFQLRDELQKDTLALSSFIRREERRNHASNAVVKALKEDLPFTDSLATHFESTHGISLIQLNNAAYNTINSKGIFIISNKELRKEVQELYSSIQLFQNFLEKSNNESSRYLNPFQQELQIVKPYPFNGKTNQPLNYENLKTNFKFINTLQDNSNNLYFTRRGGKRIKENINYVLRLLDDELKTYKTND